MRIIDRRLRKLESRFVPTVDPEFQRWLQARMELGERNYKALVESGLCKPPEPWPGDDNPGQRLADAVRILVGKQR
jgi:hypothetical protein